MSWFTTKVAVTFIDNPTGKTIAVSQMTPDQLPETFEDFHTTLNLEGQEWSVVSAEPTTREQYAKAAKLTLRLHRIEHVDPRELLFSLPSICDYIPGLGDTSLADQDYELAEDDWRQIEFVSHELAAVADEEIRSIRRIHDEAKAQVGWRDIHVRKSPELPITLNIALSEIVHLLGVRAPLAGVGYHGGPKQIADGFSFALPSGETFYGTAPAGRVQVLALAGESLGTSDARSIERLSAMAKAYDLDLVQWCRCCRAQWNEPLFADLLSGKA
jgi:hypothetical protein